jgi:hypothetical protein
MSGKSKKTSWPPGDRHKRHPSAKQLKSWGNMIEKAKRKGTTPPKGENKEKETG